MDEVLHKISKAHPVTEAGRPEVHSNRARKLQEAARERVSTKDCLRSNKLQCYDIVCMYSSVHAE